MKEVSGDVRCGKCEHMSRNSYDDPICKLKQKSIPSAFWHMCDDFTPKKIEEEPHDRPFVLNRKA